MRILEEMKVRRLFCDGGMGSLLQARGLKPGELPERWNLTHRDVLISIHRSYLEAGADIMTTNTFGANGLKFKEDLEPIVTAAVENARTAVKEAGHGYVALDLGPTGRLLKPLGDLEFEDAVKLYKEVVSIGARAGADLVLIETMSDSYELKAAVLDDLKKVFRPEFLNRLDETIVFTQLGRTEIQAIARRMLERVGERMKALGVTLRFTDRALETLADQGFDPDYGARPLRRTIRAQVEDVAAEQLLSGALQAGDTALVDGAENGLRLYAQPAGTQALNTKENEL